MIPVVEAVLIKLVPPGLDDLRSDLTHCIRICMDKFAQETICALPCFWNRSLNASRDNQWEVVLAIRNDTIVAILPKESGLFGLAVDVGTTKVSAYLVDLKTGETLAKAGAIDPSNCLWGGRNQPDFIQLMIIPTVEKFYSKNWLRR